MAMNFLTFLGGEIALILSHYSRWIRISLFPFLFLAVLMMHAVVHGFCLLLTLSSERELRPWEVFGEDDESVAPLDPAKYGGGDHNSTPGSIFSFDDLASRGATSKAGSDAASHTTRSTCTRRSRMSRMNPFGPGNAFGQEAWVERWNKVSWWRKGVWTFSMGKVPSYEEGINEIRLTILYQSVLWSTIITIPVMVVVVALPVCNLY